MVNQSVLVVTRRLLMPNNVQRVQKQDMKLCLFSLHMMRSQHGLETIPDIIKWRFEMGAFHSVQSPRDAETMALCIVRKSSECDAILEHSTQFL